MPGNKKNPVDGKILISYGEVQAEGRLMGETVARTKEVLAKELPEFGVPLDATARVVTMDNEDEAWKQVDSKEEDTIVSMSTEWGLQIFQGVAKAVPDSYVIRKADIFITFTDKAT